jgi:BirA family biotin operon repressor/biotin-[acetyl-CoA-carboxylase] ligase
VITWVDEADSTQDLARASLDRARHLDAYAARRQRAGRGRLGRAWEAPVGASLAITVVLRPALALAAFPGLTLAAAVAARQVTGPVFRIKWPNDLLAPDGRKVAGILAEVDITPQGPAVLLGFGLNLSAAPALPTATHLAAWGVELGPDAAAEAFVASLGEQVDAWTQDRHAVLDAWRAGWAHRAARVRVGLLEGVAEDIDEDGALRIDGQRVVGGMCEVLDPVRHGDAPPEAQPVKADGFPET